MEIKIQCYCGTKYKFDVEPVNGRVPFQVKCPTCAVDATEFANGYVQQLLGFRAPPPVPVASPAPAETATPAPVRVAVAAGPIRVNTPVAVAAGGTPTEPPMPPSLPASSAIRAGQISAVTPVVEAEMGPRFFLGLLGALLGAVLACLIWYLLFHYTGTKLRVFAIGVGLAAGFGAKLLSKDEGSTQLGMITATLALVGIVLTAYSIGRERTYGAVGEFGSAIYEAQMDYARRALKALPTGSDAEIKQFLAKENAEENEKPEVTSVSPQEIQQFRNSELPMLRELASSNIKKEDFPRWQREWWHKHQVAEAKAALAFMPNETDAQIRSYLARDSVDLKDEDAEPRTVTAEEIQEFREEQLPRLKELASTQKPPEIDPELDKTPEQLLKETEAKAGDWMKIMYFFAGWGSIGGIGTLIVSLGAAYKICANAG
jgi:hypothetical protein